MKSLSDTVGYTLLKMTDKQMLIEKGGTYFILDFEIEKGEDCTRFSTEYADIESVWCLDESFLSYSEAIALSVISRVEYYYPPTRDSRTVTVSFYNSEEICLAKFTASAGSCIGEKNVIKVSVKCDRLQLSEVLTEW